MPRITGGTVKFSKKRVPAQYESEDAEIVLSFAADESDLADVRAWLDGVQTEIRSRCLDMLLGRTPTRPAQARPAPTVEEPPAEVKAKKTRKVRLEPAPVEEAPPADDVPPGEEALSAVEEDFMVDAPADEPSITDEELNEACKAAAKRMGAPKVVRETVAQYAPQVAGVPQANRAELLAKIKALKPAK